MNELGRFMKDDLTNVSCVAESGKHLFYFIVRVLPQPSVVLLLSTRRDSCHALMLMQLSESWR